MGSEVVQKVSEEAKVIEITDVEANEFSWSESN